MKTAAAGGSPRITARAAGLARALIAASALATAVASGPVAAQAYPTKPIRVVVAIGAGTAGDLLLRQLTPKIGELLGQSVVVDNRPGGGGVPGTASVARSAPDGYTLLFAYSQTVAVNPHLYKQLSYDPLKDFAGVARVAAQPLVFVVSKTLPIKSVPEFIAYAKANPGKLNFASSGNGTSSHLSGIMINVAAGINTVHVPYNSVPQALVDLGRGDVSYMMYPYVGLLPAIQGGRVQPLATTGASRASFLPELPSMVESGYPEFVIAPWFGFYAPAGTPKPIIEQWSRAVGTTLKQPELIKLLANTGTDTWYSGPEELERFTASEIERYGKLVKMSGAKAD